MDEAKALIDASNAKMTNDINKQNADTNKATQIGTAAGDVLRPGVERADGRRPAAATPVHDRHRRARTAWRSPAAGSKMTSIPGARVGEGLVNGLQDG